MNPQHGIVRHVVLALLVAQLCGCSVLGLGIGMTNNTPSRIHAVSSANQIRQDEEVTVFMQNGARYRGRYAGTSFSSIREYRERYWSWQQTEALDAPFPVPGERVYVVLRSNDVRAGRLAGFDPGVVLLDTGQAIPESIPSERIHRIAMKSKPPCDAPTLMQWNERYTLPSRTTVRVQQDGELLILDATGVDRLYVPGNNNAMKGFLFGFGVDVLFWLGFSGL